MMRDSHLGGNTNDHESLLCQTDGRGTHVDETQRLSFTGYKLAAWNEAVFWALVMATGGLAYLPSHWSVRCWLKLRLAPSCRLDQATHVLVVEAPDSAAARTARTIHRIQVTGNYGSQTRLLEHRGCRFLLHLTGFQPVPDMPSTINEDTQQALESIAAGRPLPSPVVPRHTTAVHYGPNTMILEVKHPGLLVWREMWHPYFVFQYFSVIVWMSSGYVVYSVVIVAITWMAILTQVYNTWSQSRRLADLVKQEASVKRAIPAAQRPAVGFETESISSSDLVPGDVVVVEGGQHVSCDMVLLSGAAVLDEALLTGESIPVRKSAWHAHGPLDPVKHMEFIIPGGTDVLQAFGRLPGEPVLAMVARTGFRSAKGALVQSMLQLPSAEGTFERDTLMFIALMSAMSLVMYLVSVVAFVHHHDPWGEIVFRFLDMITVAVPPALPASMQVALAISVWRLQLSKVFVIEPKRIIMAGGLDAIAFDKTGTLTESHLNLESLWLVNRDDDGSAVTQHLTEGSKPRQSFEIDSSEAPGEPTFLHGHRDARRAPTLEPPLDPTTSFSVGATEECEACGSPPLWDIIMATCHGLTVIEGEIVGDPLDKTLFESTGWSMLDGIDGVHPPRLPGMVYAIQKRYTFSSEDMRSTAVVELPDGQRMVVCKGSPERVAEVSGYKALPIAFAEQLHRLMSQGARCVVLAGGMLGEEQTADLPRAEVEACMDLIGVAAMSAPIKAGTAPTIAALHNAQIRTFMVTGDHMATAVHTARKAGIMQPQWPVVCIEEAEGATREREPNLSAFPFLSITVLSPESDQGEPRTTDTSTLAVSLSPAGTFQAELLQMVAEGRAHLAVTGKALAAAQRHNATEALVVIHESGAVFARMLPNAKASLLSAISGACEGSKIGFVGDGANDIMALREAHVGLSLCEAEASIAAPLTSKEQSPYSIVKAMAEGRAVLSCSYQTVQYIVIYAYIQVLGLNILYFHNLIVGDYQYLIQDLLFVTTTSALMGYTAPKRTLSSQRPAERLLTWETTMFVVVQIGMVTAFQLVALEVLNVYSGEGGGGSAAPQPKDPQSQSLQGSVIFVMSLWQLLTAGLLTNRPTPFRRSALSNGWLVLALSFQAAFTLLLALLPGGETCWVSWTVAMLVPLPLGVRLWLVACMALHTGCSWSAGSLVHWAARWRSGQLPPSGRHRYSKLS